MDLDIDPNMTFSSLVNQLKEEIITTDNPRTTTPATVMSKIELGRDAEDRKSLDKIINLDLPPTKDRMTKGLGLAPAGRRATRPREDKLLNSVR